MASATHKLAVTPPLNAYKFLHGFSAYDEWQKPRTHAPNAVKNGMIASQRRLGANTLTPLFSGWTKHAELTEKFLRDHVLTVNIFTLRREATGTAVAPLSVENSIKAVLLGRRFS